MSIPAASRLAVSGSPSRAGTRWPSTSRWTSGRGSFSFVRLAIRAGSIARPRAGRIRGAREASSGGEGIDLRGEDEIVLGEAADGVGPEGDLHPAVMHAEVGVVA